MPGDAETLAVLREIALLVRENTMELRALRRDQLADTVDTDEACRILRVSDETLRRRVRAGEIRQMKHGNRVLYSRRELSEYLRQRGV